MAAFNLKDRVRVRNMNSHTQLNGKIGTVIDLSLDAVIYRVKLDDGTNVDLAGSNLEAYDISRDSWSNYGDFAFWDKHAEEILGSDSEPKPKPCDHDWLKTTSLIGRIWLDCKKCGEQREE